MKPVTRFGLTALAVALSAPALATNGDQMLGATATQWAMGGAVVAAPQDTGTLFTNPAGLAWLGMDTVRFDLSPGFLNPPREVNGRESDSNLFFLPAGAVGAKVNDRLYLGLGLAAQSGMGVDFPDALPAPNNQAIVTTRGVFKIAPTVAFKLNDQLSLGASLNIDYQSLALSNPQLSFPQNQQFGFGATLGAVYRVSDLAQLGASWISKQDISDHEFNTSAGKFSLDLDVPQQLAVGLALRPMPGLLVEADVKWINFSDTTDIVPIQRPVGYVGTVPAQINFGWDDQVVYSLGVRKEMGTGMALMAGVNYGKSPIEENDVDANLGSVAIPEWHLSVGLTRKLGKNFAGSLSFTHAFENEITSNSGSNNTIKIEQNVFYAQISYQL
jgi:long-chain fatty acid transport protein